MSDYDPYDELPELPDDLILPPYLRQNGEGGMRTYGELPIQSYFIRRC